MFPQRVILSINWLGITDCCDISSLPCEVFHLLVGQGLDVAAFLQSVLLQSQML